MPLVSKDIESQLAVRVVNVSKRFKVYHHTGSGWVKELLFPWKRNEFYDEFTAIQDASLNISRGEVVGVIGPNGAGKSTLLKMIAGLLPIDAGQVQINGKVTAVMAMGVGIHPEFSGRENILYGAMLLGMSKREVLRKMPMIVEFSELGEYIDRPLRTYSSGMAARLLFAIAMSVDPDILIVDEALATGDRRFDLKCIRRIRQFCRSGATILFVSHDMALVQDLCQRVVFMNEGRVEFIGEPGETIQRYQAWADEKRMVDESVGLANSRDNDGIVVTDLRYEESDTGQRDKLRHGGSLRVEVDYYVNDPSITHFHVAIGFLRGSDQMQVGETSTHQEHPIVLDVLSVDENGAHGRIVAEIEPLLLLSHHYSLVVRFFGEFTVHGEHRDNRRFFVQESDPCPNPDASFIHPGAIRHESTRGSIDHLKSQEKS